MCLVTLDTFRGLATWATWATTGATGALLLKATARSQLPNHCQRKRFSGSWSTGSWSEFRSAPPAPVAHATTTSFPPPLTDPAIRCPHSYDPETFHAEMSEDEIGQVRAKIKATQASIRKSHEKKQKVQAADLDYIRTFWNQYKVSRAKRSNDNLEPSTNATKKLKTTHCEESAVKFAQAITMFDIHEERCNPPPVTHYSTNQLFNQVEAFRLGERRRQIAILKDLGFEFNPNIDEIDQTSVGRIWLQCMLHRWGK